MSTHLGNPPVVTTADYHDGFPFAVKSPHPSVPLSLPRAPTAEVVPPRDLGTSGES